MKDDRSTWVYIFDFVPSAGLLMAIKKPLFLPQSSTFRETKGMNCFVDVVNVTSDFYSEIPAWFWGCFRALRRRGTRQNGD